MYTSNHFPVLGHGVQDKVEEASVSDGSPSSCSTSHRPGLWAARLPLCVPAPLARGTRGGHFVHTLPITVPFPGAGVWDRERGKLELEPKRLCWSPPVLLVSRAAQKDTPGFPEEEKEPIHRWRSRAKGAALGSPDFQAPPSLQPGCTCTSVAMTPYSLGRGSPWRLTWMEVAAVTASKTRNECRLSPRESLVFAVLRCWEL